jgi:hypothetical protein
MSIVSDIGNSLDVFSGISLEEIKDASLMRRKDCKYVFEVSKLPGILRSVSDEYKVLQIQGLRAHDYQTFYYDTPDLDMYHMHHNGRVNRHKIRIRRYGTSDDAFLEVKKKDSRGVTIKNRVAASDEGSSILNTDEEFLSLYTPYAYEGIIPVLENSFRRITLVSSLMIERVTLDFQLWFSSQVSEESIELPGMAVAEIKFSGRLSKSPFHSALREAGVVPRRFSKYAIGMALLNPELKQNLFKEKIRLVKKIHSTYFQKLNHSTYA